jgi:hypothetical protein
MHLMQSICIVTLLYILIYNAKRQSTCHSTSRTKRQRNTLAAKIHSSGGGCYRWPEWALACGI